MNKAILNEMTVDQLFALRDMVAETIKEKNGFAKVEAKKTAEDKKVGIERQVRAAIAAKMIAYGSKIVVMFKGKEQTFEVKGLSDKTFTVNTEDGIRYIRFAAFIRIAE